MRQNLQLIPVLKLMYQRLTSTAVAGGIDPALILFGKQIDPPTNGIVVAGSSSSRVNWATVGSDMGSDEEFVLTVLLYAGDEAQDLTAALDKIDTYSKFVQNSVRDIATGRATTWFQTSLGARMLIPSIVSFNADTTGNPRGVLAQGDVGVNFKVRI